MGKAREPGGHEILLEGALFLRRTLSFGDESAGLTEGNETHDTTHTGRHTS